MENEESVKIRLESLPRRQLFIHSGVFAVAFFVMFSVAMLAPDLFYEQITEVEVCDSYNYEETCFVQVKDNLYWSASIKKVSKYNQVLFMMGEPKTTRDIEFELELLVKLEGFESQDQQGKLITEDRETHQIKCEEGNCNKVLIFYEPFIEYENYLVKVEVISGLETESVVMELGYVNSDFTTYQMGAWYSFFGLSVLSMTFYIWQLKRAPIDTWSFESICIAALGGSLILFNHPLFAVSIVYPSSVLSAITAFCITQFLGAVLYFWIIVFQNMRNFPLKRLVYAVEAVVVLVFFFLIFSLYCYLHIELRNNPTYNPQEDLSSQLTSVYIALMVFLGAIGLWLLFLCWWSFPAMKTLTMRKHCVVVVNIIMIVMTFIGIAVGTFQPMPRDGALMLVYLSMCNLYVIMLQWFYAPTYSTVEEFNRQRNLEYDILKMHSEEDAELSRASQSEIVVNS